MNPFVEHMTPEDLCIAKERIELVDALLATSAKTPRKRAIMDSYLSTMNARAVGEEFGISGNRVCQIRDQVFRAIRNASPANEQTLSVYRARLRNVEEDLRLAQQKIAKLEKQKTPDDRAEFFKHQVKRYQQELNKMDCRMLKKQEETETWKRINAELCIEIEDLKKQLDVCKNGTGLFCR